MTCSRTAQVHRYHDGELSSAQREVQEAHIRHCAECRELLADLRRLSSLISGASLAGIPPQTMGRLGECWPVARDRGVLRAASWLTAAAAAVLIGALLAKPADRADVGARPAIWGTIAVMPPVEGPDDSGSDLAVMAQWMVDELSAGGQQ